MGKWKHRLTNIDEKNRTAMCSNCGEVDIKYIHSRNGWRCRMAVKGESRGQNSSSYNQRFKKAYCENPECTTTIVDPCQLDVDHMDGDSSNYSVDNLKTLCACCHRIKTKLAEDWRNTRHRV